MGIRKNRLAEADAVLTSTHNLSFEQKYEKYPSESFIWKFSVSGAEIFYIFKQACFRNGFQGFLVDISPYIYMVKPTSLLLILR